MSNLLATAANWSDGSASPPASWDGSAYVYAFVDSATLTATAAAAGTLDFTPVNDSPAQPDTPTFDISVNGASVASGDFGSGAVHLAVAAGDAIEITMVYEDTHACGYSGSFTLQPIDPLPLPALIKRLQFEVRMDADPEGTP